MRQVWVFLMLCAAAVTSAAQCTSSGIQDSTPTEVRSQPGPHNASLKSTGNAEARAIKVRAVQPSSARTPEPAGSAAAAGVAERLRQHPLGAPLLLSALVMLVIALRRGNR